MKTFLQKGEIASEIMSKNTEKSSRGENFIIAKS